MVEATVADDFRTTQSKPSLQVLKSTVYCRSKCSATQRVLVHVKMYEKSIVS